MDLTHELQIADTLARQAGALVLQLRHSKAPNYKTNGEGPVTEADEKADELIKAGLKAAFPKDPIITEESYQPSSIIPKEGRCWFVDPIDGTSDFIKQGNDFSVMIGLAIDGKAAMGVVYQPTNDVLWRGVHFGGESYSQRIESNGLSVKLDISQKPVGNKGPIAAVSKNHPSRFVDFLVEKLNASSVIAKGSVGLKLALIADGRADFYVAGTRRIRLWDTCAPHAILSAAGGIIHDLQSNPLVYNEAIAHANDIVCATPLCRDLMWPKLEEAVLQYRQKGKST